MRIFFCIAVTFLVGQAAAAQDGIPTNILNVFGRSAIYASPPWVTSSDLMAEVEISRQQGVSANGTDVFIYEYIPSNEAFETWTELYAIFAERPLDGELDAYVNGLYAQYSRACSDVHLQRSNTTPEGTALFVIYCSSYRDQPDTGQIAVINMQLAGNMLVRNYYERRVPAFDLASLEHTLPIELPELLRVVSVVAQLEIR